MAPTGGVPESNVAAIIDGAQTAIYRIMNVISAREFLAAGLRHVDIRRNVAYTQLGIVFAANIGDQTSPISSPRNLIATGFMDPQLDWGSWFNIALPVSIISIVLIWLLLLVSYQPSRAPDGDGDIEIRAIRPTRESFTFKRY